jgi:hypothetical protein
MVNPGVQDMANPPALATPPDTRLATMADTTWPAVGHVAELAAAIGHHLARRGGHDDGHGGQ